eukprot:CAMPEP_0203823236 /NCGR_PEP_ID=MMETSP0115-20131106/48624_1 /ASSEMBLY_ACC=CAM_ASM_000227 /TAXON_ID=33651 /ORGANISM="Bicosoecid sp, Strain ms1" /LENGTH=384 /DNA_ID=CAMNT_0050732271 /DNA_START=58 /DNA_END=1209 /DNA_ORIENTATION=-
MAAAAPVASVGSTRGGAAAEWPPFNPFVRHPTSTLGKIKMAFAGIVLVPVRVAGTFVTLLLLWLWVTVFSIGADSSLPYPKGRSKWLVGGCKFGARALLFFYGYWWLHEDYVVADPVARAAQPLPAVVVSNHMSFIEVLYITARYGCCFVSKAGNRKLPFVGAVADAMQCIWVDREHSRSTGDGSGSGGSTSSAIIERMNAPPGDWPPLALFPEGTTTTGHIMIHMRTGAFLAGAPVQPVAMRLPFSRVYGFDPAFSCTNIWLHALGLMSQPVNHLYATHLPVYVPSAAEKADPHLFANNVRAAIAGTLGVKTYELEWMHKLQYELSPKKQAMGARLLADHHGGVPPPPPVFTHDAFGVPLRAAEARGRTGGGGDKGKGRESAK